MNGNILYNSCFVISIISGLTLSYIISYIYLNRSYLQLGIGLLVLLTTSLLFIVTGVVLYVFNIKEFYISILIIVCSLINISGIYFILLKKSRRISGNFIMENISDSIIVLDNTNNILFLNTPALKLFSNRTIKEVSRKPINHFLPEFDEIIGEKLSKSPEIKINSITYGIKMYTKLSKKGKLVIRTLILRDISPLMKVKDQMVDIKQELVTRVNERTLELEKTNIVLLREIDDRRKSESRLKSSLEEKNILLSEVHHRVKNNLQVIISLLKLQTKYIEDEDALSAFNTAVSRIRSIAMIHEKLYKSENLSNANLSEYIHELAQYLISSHKKETESVNLIVNVKNIFLDIDSAVLCGLIINELILNALKYAFPDADKDNEIMVEFISEENTKDDVYGTGFGFELTVSDNGIGFPEYIDIENNNTLGFKIINTLVKQLKGTISVNSDNGAVIKIKF